MKTARRNLASALVAVLVLAAGLVALPAPAVACSDQPYLGTVCAFAFNFCPRGYAPASGQLLSISQNTALFSLLGTTYGGDGRTTFALPDLRGRSVAGAGTGPGLSPVTLGEKAGVEQVTLTVNQMPAHTHVAATTVTVNATARAQSGGGNTDSPGSLAQLARTNIYSTSAPNVDMAAGTINASASATTTVNPAGGSQPFGVRSPFLGIAYCIAVQGIYPSRN